MDKILPSDLYISSTYSKERKGNNLGKDEFLKILLAQLSNQDPLNPMKDQDFIAQMATFSSLEQMVNMNESMSKLYSGQMFANKLQYSELIGKDVSWTEVVETEGGEPNVIERTSKAVAVHFNGSDVQVEVENGEFINVGNINEISSKKLKDDASE
jgi:flagellar basal-body rod modification protein FlgD